MVKSSCFGKLMHRLPVILTLAALGGTNLMGATLTNLSFISNGGNFINDTIVNGTSPLAFTGTTDLAQPFLNNPDSTVSLGFGNYYAIAFLGPGQHLGAGTVSFSRNGTPFSQAVTFPANSPGGVMFASFSLPGSESVTVSTTGLSADRIHIQGDGSGLTPDGTADAFYSFVYSSPVSSVPEPGTLALAGLGVAAVVTAMRRR
jgi:hypothetical protein